MDFRTLVSALAALSLIVFPALAQGDENEPIPFASGNFTITENDDMERLLSFGGQELLRDYYVRYNQTVDIAGTEVALFEVGPGGNACGPQTYLFWQPEGQSLQSAGAGDDCGSPSPAISDYGIYFVPYLLPGATGNVQVWAPEDGLKLAGVLSYQPQSDTTWKDLKVSELTYLVDAFSNAEIFTAATTLLGDHLNEYVTGLVVSDGFHQLKPDVFYGSGCVPHACGAANSFIAIDTAGEKLYFAQQNETGNQDSWPNSADWPAEIRETMLKTLGE